METAVLLWQAFWSWLKTMTPFLQSAGLVAGGVAIANTAEKAKQGAEAAKDTETAHEISKQVDAAPDADVERMWDEFDGKPGGDRS